MKLHPRVNQTAVDLAKRFEGFRPRAGRTPDGRHTIGYGHILGARDKPDEVEISEAEAEFLLKLDLSRVAEEIEPSILAPLNDNQFAALLSFAFNIGADNFKGCSALRRLNEGAYLQAAAAIELWRRADFDGETLVVDQLVRRRAVEKALFLAPPEGFMPVPSAVLKPTFDHSVIGAAVAWAAARERTAVSRLALEGPEVSAGLAIPPGREGEPAPSAAIAATDALTVRLSRIMPETLSEPEEEPAAAPEPLALQAEPAPEEPPHPVAPASAPLDLEAPPQPDRLSAPSHTNPADEPAEAGPFPALSKKDGEAPPPPLAREPKAAVAPDAPSFRHRFAARADGAPAAGAASSPPAFEPFAEPPSLFDAPPRSIAFDEPAETPTIGSTTGTRPAMATPLFERPVFFSALGLIGVALFAGSIFCMMNKASFTCLLIGVVGVLAMAPAAAFFLFRFLGAPLEAGDADHAKMVPYMDDAASPPAPVQPDVPKEATTPWAFDNADWR